MSLEKMSVPRIAVTSGHLAPRRPRHNSIALRGSRRRSAATKVAARATAAMWASAKVPAATTPSATTSRRAAGRAVMGTRSPSRAPGSSGRAVRTGTSCASRGRSIGVRARQTTDPSPLPPLGGRPHARVREERAHASPEGGGRHPQSRKFVADVGASIPTGTSRIIDEKVCDVVIPVNALDPLYREYTSEQLRAKTDEFRARLKKGDTLDDLRVRGVRRGSASGAGRELNMRHFDVQIVGGALLHEGSICEMATGEGKTLTATLPAYLNALSGKGVHVVTVNDILARRDAEWMGRVHRALGLTVGVIQSDMEPEEVSAAYDADITYVTNQKGWFRLSPG